MHDFLERHLDGHVAAAAPRIDVALRREGFWCFAGRLALVPRDEPQPRAGRRVGERNGTRDRLNRTVEFWIGPPRELGSIGAAERGRTQRRPRRRRAAPGHLLGAW